MEVTPKPSTFNNVPLVVPGCQLGVLYEDEFKSKVEEVNVTPIKVDTSKMKKYETGAVPVPETGPAIVHKGEVIIPEPVVKKAGGSMKIENILNRVFEA